MRRLGHIELGKRKVLGLCQNEDTIVATLDGETVSTRIQVKNVKNIERGDIILIGNNVGVVNWVNQKQEINIFVNGEEQVFVFKDKCWIKLSDYLRGAKYLHVELRSLSSKKGQKAGQKKKQGASTSKEIPSKKESTISDAKKISAPVAKGKHQGKKNADDVIGLRVHFLMQAHPSLSKDLAIKVVRKVLTLPEALRMSRYKHHPRPGWRPKRDFLDVPGLVVPGSYGTGKRR